MKVKTVILGAGAAGMMCAAHAGGDCLVVDHARAPGEKIRISGGGRCNFTNLYAGPENFISLNPHFAKSALARYTQWDFIDLMARHDIAWHEKTLGQLFCDGKATQIVDMLVRELRAAGADLWLSTKIESVAREEAGFTIALTRDGHAQQISCENLVLATGGKSIPKMGATGLSYDIARQFGLALTEIRPALVPLTFSDGRFSPLAGVALPARVRTPRTAFDEALLFTHRGLSGPAILQISSYWREGEAISLDLDPEGTLFDALRGLRSENGRQAIKTALATQMPARLAAYLCDEWTLSGPLADHADTALSALSNHARDWSLTPSGSEGYRTAEVTLGGIDTAGLDSKTMQARTHPGLYVIGEAVDVTGWLGGYNFQWAWASGAAAGRAIATS